MSVELSTDIEYMRDGTIKFLFHHACYTLYGLREALSNSDIANISSIITNNGGEFLSNLVRDHNITDYDIFKINDVYIDANLSGFVDGGFLSSTQKYGTIEACYVITFEVSTKVDINFIKLKYPTLYSDIIHRNTSLLKEMGIESPLVFIEEFIFHHESIKHLFLL